MCDRVIELCRLNVSPVAIVSVLKSLSAVHRKKRLLGSRCRVQQVVVEVRVVGVVIVDNIHINTSTQTLYIKTLILSREEISFQGRKISLFLRRVTLSLVIRSNSTNITTMMMMRSSCCHARGGGGGVVSKSNMSSAKNTTKRRSIIFPTKPCPL